MMPIRDEADVVGECLNALLQWADSITVYDTGSNDETWQIVNDYSTKDRRIIPLAHDSVYFNDSVIRGYVFDKIRGNMKDGDWFLRVDADEFYHESPREFVQNRLRRIETIVYRQYYDFRYTEDDLRRWRLGEVNAALPVGERLRYYIPSAATEPRMCKYRSSMKWPCTVSFPFYAGVIARERLPIRHYPNRDPVQMKRRCILREFMLTDPDNAKYWGRGEWHWHVGNWTKLVVPMSEKGLVYWKPGSILSEVSFENHRATSSLLRDVMKFTVMQSGIIRLLDRRKPGWLVSDAPKPIPPHVESECHSAFQEATVDLCLNDLESS